jgi:hypothetical protein
MKRTLASIVMAGIAAGLWLLWAFEHEQTGIRAPWTGLTYAASALAFVVVGVVGRGWRAIAIAIAVAAAAVALVDPLMWHMSPSEPGVEASCDPGCISRPAAAVLAGAAAALLVTVGIVLRRGFGLASRCGSRAAVARVARRARSTRTAQAARLTRSCPAS